MTAAWESQIYRETALIVLSFLFLSGVIVYLLRQKAYYFVVSWASIKSWLVIAPILFVLFGLPQPWPLIFLTLTAIQGTKVFFQLMGMYHRTLFVWLCYIGVAALGYSIHVQNNNLYNVLPMAILGASCLIPLIRNNYKSMIQYICLTNLAFVFLGWSFLHLGLIMQLEKGIYQLMYLLILTEICDNTTLAISRYVGKAKMFDRIDYRRTVAGFMISAFLTIVVAGAMRQLLPDRSDIYWLASGIIACLGGLFGDLVMDVIRRDAGVKVVGSFVLGKGDFLMRMDRLIFVAPIYYYTMLWLSKVAH